MRLPGAFWGLVSCFVSHWWTCGTLYDCIIGCVVPLWECGSPFRKRFFYSPGIVSIVY